MVSDTFDCLTHGSADERELTVDYNNVLIFIYITLYAELPVAQIYENSRCFF